MGYRDRRSEAVAERTTSSAGWTADLARRAGNVVGRALRQQQWAERVKSGARTPVGEVEAIRPDLADVEGFLTDMGKVGNLGAVTFKPAEQVAVRPVAMPDEGRRGRRRRAVTIHREEAQAAAAAAPAEAPAWETSTGWVVGTVKNPPNWVGVSEVEPNPLLVVLFTDATVGIAPSVVHNGRISPNLNAQPQALPPEARIFFGEYAPVVPNVLNGAAELDPAAAAYLGDRHVPGSVFADRHTLGHVLEDLGEDYGLLETPFVELNAVPAYSGNGVVPHVPAANGVTVNA